MSKSIIHVLNAKIQNLIPLKYARETRQYHIFYEEKVYSIHKLLVKIQKGVNISHDNIDININVYNRLTIKVNKDQSLIMLRPDSNIDKTIAIRIVKTKYEDLPPKYINFLQIREKKTWVGAEAKFIPEIQECGMIVKDPTVCYKIISTQKANTHWMRTIIVVKQTPQPVKIGKLEIITSRMNFHEKDIYA
jgi:hypothetical protein